VILYSVKDSLGISNYATGPTITGGAITAVTLKAGKFAHEFVVEEESIEATCDSIGESAKNSNAYEHKTVIPLAGNSAEDIDNAIKLCRGRVGVFVELNDGTWEAYHYLKGGKVQRGRNIGKALDDMNGSTLTITSRQKLPEMKISSVLVNAMLPE
jgi:hypothetical protein